MSAAGHRLTFVLTLWVALVTAILCALWPAGLPLTKSVGSAFNPSTTAVVLRGRTEQLRPPIRRILKAEPETLASPTSIAASAMNLAVPPALLAPETRPALPERYPRYQIDPENQLTLAFFPTGPPLA